MAKVSLAILMATTLTMASTANAYTACKEGLDICGWALQNAGYPSETLAFAAEDAGQDAGVGTFLYDSIYNCYPDGEIVWSVWCGGGGQCDKAASAKSHSYCKGDPVYTGSGPWEGWEGAPAGTVGKITE